MSYIYRVSGHVHETAGGRIYVEVGIFDPERWDGAGGMSFSETADVRIEIRSYDGELKVGVNQGGTSRSIEQAERAADVFGQAIAIGRFVRDQIDAGEEPSAVLAFLVSDELNRPGQRPLPRSTSTVSFP